MHYHYGLHLQVCAIYTFLQKIGLSGRISKEFKQCPDGQTHNHSENLMGIESNYVKFYLYHLLLYGEVSTVFSRIHGDMQA